MGSARQPARGESTGLAPIARSWPLFDQGPALHCSNGDGLARRASASVLYPWAEGGNHFMFMENPEKFNRIVKEFIG